jgi:hypothetical protein
LPGEELLLNETLEVVLNGSRTFSDGLQVTLTAINDSRCPEDVECVWEGELAATLQLTGGALGSDTLQVNLGHRSNPRAEAGDYTIDLELIAEDKVTISVRR